tara:strand:- start:128 stop:730 length:603 start_codon:yes stop_codon:yes gene_type:complete
MITIINNETGNFASVLNMLKKIGVKSELTDSYDKISKSKILILPGVGSFNQVMTKIYEKKIDKAIHNSLENNGKILGICAGMQALFNKSEEGELKGLELIEGEVKKFDFKSSKFKVPHMGWNKVDFDKTNIFNEKLADNKFYFAHSFYVSCKDKKDIIGITNHSIDFTSVIKKKNIYGAQFHPEKSHFYGKKFLQCFIDD